MTPAVKPGDKIVMVIDDGSKFVMYENLGEDVVIFDYHPEYNI